MADTRLASEQSVERLTISVEKLTETVTQLRVAMAEVTAKEADFTAMQADVKTLMDERQQGIGKRALLVPVFMFVGGLFEGTADWFYHFFNHSPK